MHVLLALLLPLAPSLVWGKPNFVYILADDQDAFSANADFMPNVAKYIAQQGKNYTNFYAPVSLCCPSRTSFLRGQYAHNHNATFVSPPFGGWEKFNQMGYNGKWMPSYLQEAGYQTYYSGKVMNGLNVNNWNQLPAKGLNHSNLLLNPWTYAYFNATFSVDGAAPKRYDGLYQVDVIRDMGLAHIENAVMTQRPFFIALAPTAPHSQLTPLGNGQTSKGPPVPPARYLGRLEGLKVPRSYNFNPNISSGVSWVYGQPRRNSSQVDYIDQFYQARQESVLALDDLVKAVVDKLDAVGVLNNTYIIYTADNGFTLGQHRRWPGKSLGYEEDIRVPLLIRGPNITSGNMDLSIYNVADLSTTIMHLAGAEADHDLDGRVMTWGFESASKKQIGDDSYHLSEYWDSANTIPGPFTSTEATTQNNSIYRTLRLKENGSDWMYSVWCTGSRELYDMKSDFGQMENLVASINAKGAFAPLVSSSSSFSRVASRLDAVVLWLKACKGTDCRRVWPHIFPNGEAKSFVDAMSPQWDTYFDDLPKVAYASCDLGYHLQNEFPNWTTDLPYTSYTIPNKPNAGDGGDRKRKRDQRAPLQFDQMAKWDVVNNCVEEWMNGWLDM